jgi:alpha-L-rhamnosidase
VFAPAAARYQDTRGFLSKWMADVRDAQKANGNIPAVVPQPGNAFDETGVGWSDAVISVPYAVWHAFGDERILRENWAAMKSFYNFVHQSATGDGDLLEQGRSSWFSGDWLTLESVSRLEEHKVIGTAYFAESTRMMSEMAAAMGEPAWPHSGRRWCRRSAPPSPAPTGRPTARSTPAPRPPTPWRLAWA